MPRILRILLIAVVVIVVVLIGAYVVLAAITQPMPAHPFFRESDPPVLVIAHQGGDGERPSNTMLAFQHAVEIGVDVLEMDVHSSSDGVLVVIHDDTVDRTTDGTGLVNEMTIEELQALDAGYDWPTLQENENPPQVEGNPYRGQGVQIPALEDVLAAFPEMRMVIEIKQETPSIVEPLCTMLRDYEMQDQVIVASFRPAPLYAFRETCPEVATSAVEEEIRPFYIAQLVGMSEVIPPPAHAFQVPEYSGDLHVVTQGFVNAAQAQNIKVQTWTVNYPDAMQRMIDLGVNGIITDYPSLLLEMLSEG